MLYLLPSKWSDNPSLYCSITVSVIPVTKRTLLLQNGTPKTGNYTSIDIVSLIDDSPI